MVLVEFPSYSGRSCFADVEKSKWVPISECDRRDENMCCCRRGIPLVVAAADSIHSLQGLTIGNSHLIKRLVIRW